jgi:stage V sporulation protein AF
MKLGKDIQSNISLLDEALGISKSFDVINREIMIGDRNA